MADGFLNDFALVISIIKDFSLIILSVVIVSFLIISYAKLSVILNRLLNITATLERLTINLSEITELFSKSTLETRGISYVVGRIFRTIIGKSTDQKEEGDFDEKK